MCQWPAATELRRLHRPVRPTVEVASCHPWGGWGGEVQPAARSTVGGDRPAVRCGEGAGAVREDFLEGISRRSEGPGSLLSVCAGGKDKVEKRLKRSWI